MPGADREPASSGGNPLDVFRARNPLAWLVQALGRAGAAGLEGYRTALSGRDEEGRRVGAVLPVAYDEQNDSYSPAFPRILDLWNTAGGFAPAGGVTLGAGPVARAARQHPGDLGFQYARRTSGPDPDTGAGYMMFRKIDGPTGTGEQFADAADDTFEALAPYGGNKWLGRPVSPAQPEEFAKDAIRALREDPDILSSYGGRAAPLVREMSPENIVDSAGFWDSPELVEILWNRVLEPRGIYSVVTPDGMILFDRSGVRAADAAFDPARIHEEGLGLSLSPFPANARERRGLTLRDLEDMA